MKWAMQKILIIREQREKDIGNQYALLLPLDCIHVLGKMPFNHLFFIHSLTSRDERAERKKQKYV